MDYAFTRLDHEISKNPIPGFARKSQQGRVYVGQLQRHSLCSLGFNVFDFVRHGPSGTLITGITLHRCKRFRTVADFQIATCTPNQTTMR